MIKIENVSVAGFEAAVRGMRNPLNSWAKSDSHVGMSGDEWSIDPGYIIGPEDEKLMRKLAKGGPVHAKYRRQIVVWCDITAPLRWWKEFDTYRFGRERNSCSTMHKIADHEFTEADMSWEKIDEEVDIESSALGYTDNPVFTGYVLKEQILEWLNYWREEFLKAKEAGDKEREEHCFQQMVDMLPDSYMQRATIMMSYEVLANCYRWRRNHKQEEWREFCKWSETLPYSWVFTGDKEEKAFSDEVTMVAKDVEKDMGAIWKIEYSMPVYLEDIPFKEDWNKDGRTMCLYIDDTFVAWLYESRPYGTNWNGEDIIELTFLISQSLARRLPSYDLEHYCAYGFTLNEEENEIQLRLYRKG